MSCSGCNLNRPIQNKKYNLCGDCVFKKSHDGKSKQEVYAERAKPPKIYTFKRIAVKQQKPKERVVKQELSALKTKIEIDAIFEDKYYCWGCGKSQIGLDKSHILAVGKRKDLELLECNINLFCRDCHMSWESGNIAQMLRLNTFESDLNVVLAYDIGFYGVIINKIHHFLKWRPDFEPETEEIAKKAENILKIFGEKVGTC